MLRTHNFADDFCGSWKTGAFPKDEGANVVVQYGQTFHAYNIDMDQYELFIDWVAAVWPQDNDPVFDLDYAGDVYDYLQEIGVDVRMN